MMSRKNFFQSGFLERRMVSFLLSIIVFFDSLTTGSVISITETAAPIAAVMTLPEER